jgi:hypothetical protein
MALIKLDPVSFEVVLVPFLMLLILTVVLFKFFVEQTENIRKKD